MTTQIKLRRGTSSEWTSINPTLAAGEAGFETDTNKVKIGDGSTAWTSLNYAAQTDLTGYATENYVDTSVSSKAPLASPTFTGTLNASNVSISGTTSINEIMENVSIDIVSAYPTNIDILNGAIKYYTSNLTSNFTINFRGDSSTTLKNVMSADKSISVAILVTNGSTAYYPTTFQIDGATVTPYWQGGSAPSSGNANSIDLYTFTIIWYDTHIPSGNPVYRVLASQTRFA